MSGIKRSQEQRNNVLKEKKRVVILQVCCMGFWLSMRKREIEEISQCRVSQCCCIARCSLEVETRDCAMACYRIWYNYIAIFFILWMMLMFHLYVSLLGRGRSNTSISFLQICGKCTRDWRTSGGEAGGGIETFLCYLAQAGKYLMEDQEKPVMCNTILLEPKSTW